MIKKFSYAVYKILFSFDWILKKLFKRSILIFFKEYIEIDAYKSIKILDNNIKFFIPNEITKWRVDTFFSKEPETLEWIDSFKNDKKFIFWDIGANIGLYSIYTSLKHSNAEIISFEPSTSNLRVLSRNISINNLNERIKISQFPLTNKKNRFLLMKEGSFSEGGALNTFGEDFDFEGKRFISNNSYKILGTDINHLLDDKILSLPRYIKIDVDGIEHLILEGGNKYLNNENLESLSIEINEDFKSQYNKVLEIMNKNNFKLKHKKHSKLLKDGKHANTYNFVFEK